ELAVVEAVCPAGGGDHCARIALLDRLTYLPGPPYLGKQRAQARARGHADVAPADCDRSDRGMAGQLPPDPGIRPRGNPKRRMARRRFGCLAAGQCWFAECRVRVGYAWLRVAGSDREPFGVVPGWRPVAGYMEPDGG